MTLADCIFTVAMLGMAYGFYLAWPPLGLIVPCGVVAVRMLFK